MVVATDSSFLFALYGSDCHSGSATTWIAANEEPLWISALTDFELRNALRFSEFSKRMAPGTANSRIVLFENSQAAGRILLDNANLATILAEANRISVAYTLSGGHRSFDILHVASAKILEATHFLTFETNQKKLAETEGLIVPF